MYNFVSLILASSGTMPIYCNGCDTSNGDEDAQRSNKQAPIDATQDDATKNINVGKAEKGGKLTDVPEVAPLVPNLIQPVHHDEDQLDEGIM